MAVLAGILIKVAYGIIDVKFIKIIKYAPAHDLYVMILVFVLTVFYDIVFAVGAGVTLAALLFARQAAMETKVQVTRVQDKKIMELEREIEHLSNHKIRVIHIDGVFFFGSTNQIIQAIEDLMGTKYLIINFESITHLDISAIFALEATIVNLKSRGIKVLIVLKSPELEEQLEKLGIIGKIKPANMFYNEIEAINQAKKYLKIKVVKKKEQQDKKAFESLSV